VYEGKKESKLQSLHTLLSEDIKGVYAEELFAFFVRVASARKAQGGGCFFRNGCKEHTTVEDTARERQLYGVAFAFCTYPLFELGGRVSPFRTAARNIQLLMIPRELCGVALPFGTHPFSILFFYAGAARFRDNKWSSSPRWKRQRRL